MVEEGGAGAGAVWMIRWAKEVMGWNDGEWGTGISEGAEVVLLGASMQGEDTGNHKGNETRVINLFCIIFNIAPRHSCCCYHFILEMKK